jgi:murein DD-endopeptidase MepM/ murein hydrolase activator NlpD
MRTDKDVTMTKRDSNRRFQGFSSQRSLLISGIGLLGGIGVLSTGVAYAQTDPASADSPAVPNAQDLLLPTAQEVPAPEPIAPESLGVPLPPESSAPVEIEPIAPEVSEPAEGTAIDLGADSSVPDDALVSPDLVDNAKAAFEQNSSSYIDPTPYSLGATSPDVILSERSTGCQAVVQPGQSIASICPEAPAAVAYSGSFGAGGSSASSEGGFSGYQIGSVTLPSVQEFYNLTVRPPARLSNGNVNLMFPLSIPAAITSVFGWRIHPIAGESRFHSGTDLGAPMGTPVVAAFGGKVQIADFLGGYGLAVVIRHNNDTEETLYGHMSELFVKPGETVKQGEVIGRVGSTGYSTGPHLHFEFRKLMAQGWTVLDPGQALEYSLAQLIQGIQPGQAKPRSLFASISWKSLQKALEMAEAKKQKLQAEATQPLPSNRKPVSPTALSSDAEFGL